MSDPKLVYVCEGGDCTEKGSGDLHDKLREELVRLDPDEEKVRVRRYPCFGGCECGINVTVYPDRLFYSRVTADELPEIVAHLLGDGPPVERLQGAVQADVEDLVWMMLDSPY